MAFKYTSRNISCGVHCMLSFTVVADEKANFARTLSLASKMLITLVPVGIFN